MIAALILAAGSGSRFGSQKLLTPLAGRPLVQHVISNTCASSVDRVICVLGSDAEAIKNGVDFGRAETVVARRWQDGQAASLRTGVAELADVEAVVVVLGDQPLISADAIDRVLKARGPGSAAVRASYDGIAAHPTVIEQELFGQVMQLDGDIGARGLLGRASVRDVPCDDCGTAADVDTPRDLQALERRLITTRSNAGARSS